MGWYNKLKGILRWKKRMFRHQNKLKGLLWHHNTFKIILKCWNTFERKLNCGNMHIEKE